MLLLYAGVTAVVLGLVVHAVLPHRALTGVVLLPAVAGSACAITWVALRWAGVPEDGGAVWFASLLAAVLASAVVGTVVRGRRRRADAGRLAEVARI